MRWWPFRRRDRKGGEARSISFSDVWGSGRDSSVIRGDQMDTALRLVPVFAATRLLADSIASLPLHTFRQIDQTRTRIANPSLLEDPTQFGTVYDWVHRAMTSLTLRGNAFGLVTNFDAQGQPRQVEWLHPDDVSVDDDETTRRPVWRWRGRVVDPDAIVHIPGYTIPGRVLGMSPIAAYAMTIETGLRSQEFGRDWFRNGSVPSGVLETDHEVDKDQADVIRTRFKEAAQGRGVGVLGLGTTYKPITIPPNESQFLETMKATATQIAAIYGIPAEMIGGDTGASLTYANVEQNTLNFATLSLRPWVTRLEKALSNLLPRPQRVKFNVDSMVRVDLKTRYEAHQLGLANGFLTLDEVRELEDRPPLARAQVAAEPEDGAEEGEDEDEGNGGVVPLRQPRGA